ncbi:MAG TPA: hypothetical protein VGF61_22495 [Candidatus Acidoferrum sp.]|jgi:hypothetical protein
MRNHGFVQEFLPGLAILVFAALIPCRIVAQESVAPAEKEHLVGPIAEVSYEKPFKTPGPGGLRWDAKYLVWWRRDNSYSDLSPNIEMYDRTGTLFGKMRIWLPEAGLMYIEDAAASKDGRVVAGGWARDLRGEEVGWFAEIAPGGNAVNYVSTTPFLTHSVTFGPDGSIWLMGYQLGPGERSDTAPDQHIVRHYGADDKLKGEHVLLSTLQCGEAYFLHVIGRPMLTASSDRVAVFLPECHKWMELSANGELLGQWTWRTDNLASAEPGGQPREITRFALTSANKLYGNVYPPGDPWLVHFDRASSQWLPVNTDDLANAGVPFDHLEGSDGEQLVYRSNSVFVWAKPEE